MKPKVRRNGVQWPEWQSKPLKTNSEDDRTALHWTPEGKRKRGRHKNTWRRTVEGELKTLNLTWALENDKLPQLAKALQMVRQTRRFVLQWIPAHCGISGNERADGLAKEGAVEDQPENSVSFSEQKTIIKALMRPRTNRDDYHTMSREQHVNLIRLRTGHNRLNAHMNRKFKLAPSPTCACGQEDQTAEHILQRCPLLDEERKEVWPSPTPLQTKLYGSRQELEKTTTFITSAGLIV
ncbi:hypothetical protein V1264_008235 [Littorina saxatilis]|uniref:RNase H type-1 domain-containing protein n=1 Tax=Littorina saxatilis TaxID=31220 RepID=A0AAN9ASK9_9CAEN